MQAVFPTMRRVFLPIFAAALIAAATGSAQVESCGLRMIVVRTESEARDILSRLEAGEPFEELARKRSTDRSARAGGYVGTVAISELKRELQDALKGLTPGQVSPITRIGAEYVLPQLLKDQGAERIPVIQAATTGDA